MSVDDITFQVSANGSE